MPLLRSNETKSEKTAPSKKLSKSAKDSLLRKAKERMRENYSGSLADATAFSSLIKVVRNELLNFNNSSLGFKLSAGLIFLGTATLALRFMSTRQQLQEMQQYEEMLEEQRREEVDRLKGWAKSGGVATAVLLVAACVYQLRRRSIRETAAREDSRCRRIWILFCAALAAAAFAAVCSRGGPAALLLGASRAPQKSAIPSVLGVGRGGVGVGGGGGVDAMEEVRSVWPLAVGILAAAAAVVVIKRSGSVSSPMMMMMTPSVTSGWTQLPCVNVPSPDGDSAFRNFEIRTQAPWEE